ncbi:MAG: tetratricopeptide repeat protein [Phycisphaerales bacterium]
MNDWVDAEHHVERAHEYYEAGRWDEAENELRQALSLNPYQPEWYFNLGLTLEAANRHQDSAMAFSNCYTLHMEQQHPDANSAVLAGQNFIRAEQYETALHWLDLATKAEPMNIVPFVHRIEALTLLNRHAEAEETFYLAQQIDPDHGELYAAVAESLAATDHNERAVWCLREAARLDPDIPRIQARLAMAYADSGRLERARQLYLRELRNDPGDIDTLLDIGELLMSMHRYAEAGEKFRRVIELEPDQPDAHFLLGELAEMEHRIADALIHYDVVIRLKKDYPGVRHRLASVLFIRNRQEDAPRIRDLLLAELRTLLAPNQAKPESEPKAAHPKHLSKPQAKPQRIREQECNTMEELGRLLLDTDLIPEAIRLYQHMIQLYPQNHRAHHGLSVALLEAEHIEDGINSAKRAIEYQPRFVPAMHNLALAYLRQRQWIKARYWVRQASRVDPDDPSLRRLRLKLRFHSTTSWATWGVLKLKPLWCHIRGLVIRPTR